MSQPYTPPIFKTTAFHCPRCDAYSSQIWLDLYTTSLGRFEIVNSLQYVVCTHCRGYSLWKDGVLIEPETAPAPLPNADLPDDIKTDYQEARAIIAKSPRGAAALLRLCVQKLCKHLGQAGKDLNADIAALVKEGLNPTVQRSLDIVRVIGNEAVHPGQIDLRDQAETAIQLCYLTNIIAQTMITQPKTVEALYQQLPASKREQIEKRDGDKSPN